MGSNDSSGAKEAGIEEYLRKKAEIDATIREKFQRPITVMFTDIVSSTEFFDERGDIAGREMIQRHNDLLHPIIEKYGGRILKELGDGLMISFESPQGAAHSAIEIQQSLAAVNEHKRPSNQIGTRISIHHGLGIVEEEDVYGDVVNTSARICALAGKGDILVSQAYIDVISERFDISRDYVGSKTLKGKTNPVDVHRILWDDGQKTDLRRAITQEALVHPYDSAALHLNISLKEGEILLVAHFDSEQAQAVRHVSNIPFPQTEIRNLVEQMEQCFSRIDLRGRTSKENLSAIEDLGKMLHGMLIPDDMNRFILENQPRVLILQLDDFLAYIPWELLHDGEQFLCLKYSMGKLVSGSQKVLAGKKLRNGKPFRMLVVADPRGDLAATKKEGLAIRRELSKSPAPRDLVIKMAGREASREFLLNNLTDYDLFHYAGHSDYDSRDPSLSGFLLSDGKFEAGCLLRLAREASLPSLVFANACQSGRAENWSTGEHLFGLAKTFLVSGVRHYIGSVLDIYDRSSAAFAEEFYRQLVRNLPIGEALRQARLKSISRYGEETLAWASYVLYGDPSFSYFTGNEPHAEETWLSRLRSSGWTVAAVAIPAALALILGGLFLGNMWYSHSLSTKLAKQGFSLLHAGQIAQAEEVFRGLEGKSPLYHQGMASVYLTRGDVDKAREVAALVEKDLPDSASLMLVKAHMALSRGDLADSEAAYRRTVEAKELEAWQEAECHFGLGRILAKRGSLTQAVEEFDRALGLDPSFLQAYTAKGLAMEGLGNLQGASEYYGKASVINASEPINAVLYRRSKDRMASAETAERRTRVDTLVSDLIKAYREGGQTLPLQDEWSSKPLYLFFLDLEAKGQPAPREGEDAFLSESIARDVAESTRVHPVERILLDRLLEELKLSSTQLSDPQTALRLGKILSARILATGTLLRYKNQLQISLRAVDTETTRVVASVSEMSAMTDDPAGMIQTLCGDLKDRVAAAYPIRGRVVEVRDGEVALNVGSLTGVAPGMKLHVVEDDGKGIELTVKEARDKTSTAIAVENTQPVQAGWRVEEKGSSSH